MNDSTELDALAAELDTMQDDCGCGGDATGMVELGSADTELDTATLESDLAAIEGLEEDAEDELTLALGGDDLSLDEELEFADTMEEGEALSDVGLEQILDLARAHPGLKITFGF